MLLLDIDNLDKKKLFTIWYYAIMFALIHFCTVNALNIIIHIFGWRRYLSCLPGENPLLQG